MADERPHERPDGAPIDMSRPLPDVLARHPDLACLRHPVLRSALESGRFTVNESGWFANIIELRGIYETRAEHLLRFSSEYAKQLRQSTLSFCAALERQSRDCQISISSIKFDGGDLLIWERADTRELLGCMVGRGTATPTDADWDRVWGPA